MKFCNKKNRRLSALFGHILSAALQRNGAAGIARAAGAGFFHFHFQAADLTKEYIAGFHVATICHEQLLSIKKITVGFELNDTRMVHKIAPKPKRCQSPEHLRSMDRTGPLFFQQRKSIAF
ncbi:MAG: hypothetical protein ACLFQY_15765 [Desulfococcaceae bacterium]